jgi:CRISPR-associated protein Cmr1
MPAVIEATFRVVTPLFCSGAESDRPELRLPSLKGVLQYWWRALAWSRLGGNLATIRRHEDQLFGSSRSGQSRVLLRMVPPKLQTRSVGTVLTAVPGDSRPVGEGARYLGYGVMEAFPSRSKGTKAGELTRACFPAPFEFTVHLLCRDLDTCAIILLLDSLRAVGMLGGLGAKSRKGYGSLVLGSLKLDGANQQCPRSIDELCATIATLRSTNGSPGLPQYTALSSQARHVLLMSDKKYPLEMLDLVGREMVRYRSWGRGGRILGGRIDSEQHFKDDHDLMKGAVRNSHPRRVAFGLPHSYGRQQVIPYSSKLDRRASPLFIHIHECEGVPVAVLSFLPARFLPKGKSHISVGGARVAQVPECQLYEPIHDFLDRLLNESKIRRNTRQESFTGAREVKA